MKAVIEGYTTVSEKYYEGRFVIVKFWDKSKQRDIERVFESEKEADNFISTL